MGPIRCPETSVKNYHTTPRNIPEERRSHQHRGGSLKSKLADEYAASDLSAILATFISKVLRSRNFHANKQPAPPHARYMTTIVSATQTQNKNGTMAAVNSATQQNLVVQNTSKPHGKSLIHKKKSWSSYSTYVSLSLSLPPPPPPPSYPIQSKRNTSAIYS
jgi:hypothetical protein